MSAHVIWETLNDYADKQIAPAERSQVAHHI